jgi:hypothetical protein
LNWLYEPFEAIPNPRPSQTELNIGFNHVKVGAEGEAVRMKTQGVKP